MPQIVNPQTQDFFAARPSRLAVGQILNNRLLFSLGEELFRKNHRWAEQTDVRGSFGFCRVQQELFRPDQVAPAQRILR